MKIDSTRWQVTTIGKILALFPGEMNYLLQHATSQEIARASLHLPLILWRWYFLKALAHDTSPYLYLDWRKEIEKWPKEGQFIPQAKLSLAPATQKEGKAQLKVDLTVNYISFDEMPLLVDYLNRKQNKPFQYEFDEKYAMDIKGLLQTEQSPDATNLDLISRYIRFCLFHWYITSHEIQKGFSEKQWFHFWSKTLHNIYENRENGFDCEVLMEAFVVHMRKTVRQYGATADELETSEKNNHRGISADRLRQWGMFWIDFAYFFLVPFSWYVPLFAPYFVDRNCFINDIKDTLKGSYSDQLPLYGPCSSIFITPFGKKYLCH